MAFFSVLGSLVPIDCFFTIISISYHNSFIPPDVVQHTRGGNSGWLPVRLH